jgi:hypothetical protein
MDIIKIDGKTYSNVLVTAIEESFTILYGEDTGRTIDTGGRMFLSPIGTFISHNVTFARKTGYEQEYDELYDYLMQPRYDGMDIYIVHDQTLLHHEAYVSNGNRPLKKITGNKALWGELKVNFIPMEADIKI